MIVKFLGRLERRRLLRTVLDSGSRKLMHSALTSQAHTQWLLSCVPSLRTFQLLVCPGSDEDCLMFPKLILIEPLFGSGMILDDGF